MANRERRLAKRRKAVAGDVVPSIRPPRPEFDEGPSDEDIERFGDVTQRCSECGTELYDDVAICWQCGTPVGSGPRSAADSVRARLAIGIVILIIVAFVLYAVL
jgi:hypothetical protein